MKKFFIITLIICLVLSVPVFAKANGVEDYIVTATALNVRTQANLEGEILGKLYNGEIVKCNGFIGQWASINFKGNKRFVYRDYIARYDDRQSSPIKYLQSDLDLLARLVNAEAGSNWLTDEHQRAVASVVLNRVEDKRFPNTIRDVIYQKGQYACTWNGMINRQPSQRAINNAKYVLNNGSTIPCNVVFQAQFKQGKGVWKYIQGHYFCY